MSGFRELTKAQTFDFLITTDKYAGAAGVMDDNQLFIIFKARDENGKLLLVNSSLITDALINGYIKIINYIGSGEYSVSLVEANPNNCDFVFKKTYNHDDSYYNVIQFDRGKLAGHRAISVAIKMEDNVYETTSLIPASAVRSVGPSFAII